MLSSPKICPHCLHSNLPTANYCFECHLCLNGQSAPAGLEPRSQELLADDNVETKPFNPDDLEVVRDRQKNRDYQMHLDNGLTCLRCSAVNSASATRCHVCQANLNTPDEIAQMRVLGSAQSSIGQVRTINEDEVGLWGRNNVLLGLVADGMGGAAAGEEASRFIREAVQAHFTGIFNGSETLSELTEDEIVYRLRAAINEGNTAINRKSQADSTMRGMGTTATGVFTRGNRAIFVHIGDSRAYLINERNGTINRVTDDHSFVEVLIASGHITRRQAAIHPMRSVLYRALGHNTTEVLDIYKITLEPGDRIVICSDGLTRHVMEEEMYRICLSSEDPASIGYELIELANLRGGEDNISVAVMVTLEDTSEAPLENLRSTPCQQLAEEENSTLRRTTQPIINTINRADLEDEYEDE